MPLLRERYISERSQMVEIITIGWSSQSNCLQGYLDFPAVLPSVLSMLQSPKIDSDNVQLILFMLRNVVEATIEKTDRKKTQILSNKTEVEDAQIGAEESEESRNDEQMSDDEQTAMNTVGAISVAKEILRQNVEAIGVNLHLFWSTNQAKLR